ncbi:MAG: tripartite tricarboxylate transporter permease [Spirochaetia bacterium]|nr:tripartite tricarboxylate transporter permease [Spirochaetia bacterium]
MLDILTGIIVFNNILMMNIGVAAGIIIGAMPGLSAVLAITILLPFTFGMGSLPAIYLLLGAYCGAIYGGSITAILINTPGTPNAIATALDGYPLTKKGRAGDALKCALVGSTFGGIISCLALIFFAPIIASAALKFGPAEYFSLCLFGLCVVVGVSGVSVVKGIIMIGLGLLISTVGIDAIEGVARFTFGKSELLPGLTSAAVMLGVFAISEILVKSHSQEAVVDFDTPIKTKAIKIKEIFHYWKTMIRASLFGVTIGAVPGTGGAIAAFLSYNVAQNSSKTPEEFGKGSLDGVLASETANNAVTGATLIPLLTLGVPGDVCMAVMLGALTMQGITPGPQLFTENMFWVYCLMGGLMLINFFLFIQGKFFIRGFMKITKVPTNILVPSIMIFCILGGFAARNYFFDVFVVLLFGFIGYWIKRFKYPVAPLAIGMVLGNLAETNLRRAMVISKGNVSTFFTKPISLAFIIISLLALFWPLLKKGVKMIKERRQ